MKANILKPALQRESGCDGLSNSVRYPRHRQSMEAVAIAPQACRNA